MPSALASGQRADISRKLLNRDLALTAKSLSGTTLPQGSPSAPQSWQSVPWSSRSCTLRATIPTTKGLQQHPQNSPAPKEGRLKLKMLAHGFESQSATFWLCALGEVTLPVWASGVSSGKWAQWCHPPAGKCSDSRLSSTLGKTQLGMELSDSAALVFTKR